jgi:hypothetical protein
MMIQPDQPQHPLLAALQAIYGQSDNESHDSLLVEIQDEPLPRDQANRPMSEETLRRVIRQRVLSEQPLSAACDFPRLLRLGQEQEVVCRKGNDTRGLAFCLYNLGLILAGLGRMEEAIHSFEESSRLGQEIGDKAIAGLAIKQLDHLRGQ